MDLDAEIERLQAELDRDSESSESVSGEESDDEHLVMKTPMSADDLIPALPSSLLPTIAAKKDCKKPVKKGMKTPNPVPVIPKAVKQEELMNYIRGYAPSERKPFFCRLCRFQGASLEEFEVHRGTPAHHANSAKDQKACFCRLCRKEFTSPAQLTEHLKGKSHKDTLLLRSDPKGFREKQEMENEQKKKKRGDRVSGSEAPDELVENSPEGSGTLTHSFSRQSKRKRRLDDGEEETKKKSSGEDAGDSSVCTGRASRLEGVLSSDRQGDEVRAPASPPARGTTSKKPKSRERTKLRRDLERPSNKKKKYSSKSPGCTEIREDDDENIFRSEDGPFDEGSDIDDIFDAL